jgi:uncharacterized protein
MLNFLKKNWKKILLGGLILDLTLLFAGTFGIIKVLAPKPETQVPIKLSFDKLELAKTPLEQEKGLMNRDSLCQKCGMIFVFPTEQPLSFWMKNTRIPLDIIFIDSTGKIVSISQNAVPGQLSPTYNSESDAKYVIEIPAGTSKTQGLEKGKTIDIQNLLQNTTTFNPNF